MNKLIPLSEYVELQLNTKQSTSEFKEAVKNYTRFLRQPLTLGIFVPVDEVGNVLKDISDDEDDDFGLCSAFIRQKIGKAKEKVLFADAVTIDRSPLPINSTSYSESGG